MVAKVISGKSLRGVLSYNEHKVGKGRAELLWAENFTTTAERLGFTQKLNHLEKLAAQNTRTKTNAVHVSLNFDPSEKLHKDTLTAIAKKYMEKIGFGGQPVLIYQHFDAGHPHLHLVTTNIETDGNRIDLHNIGRNQSETARKELEQEYKLIPAESKSQREQVNIKAINIQKVVYGKSETKQAISNVVRSVTKNWKYSSIHELNAVLNQYNVIADRGTEGSKIFDNKGLVYRLLDENGKKVGIPIKASGIYDKPTLKFLEKRYALNTTLKASAKDELKEKINKVLVDKPGQIEFEKRLAKQDVKVIYRQNDDGKIYGITYTDHKLKTVFNGSDLGKAYSAKALTEGFSQAKQSPPLTKETMRQQYKQGFSTPSAINHQPDQQPATGKTLLEAFLESKQMADMGIMPKRRKKKRKSQHL